MDAKNVKTENSGTWVSNVEHHYTDPKTGEMKVKYFGNGSFVEVQKQIEEFMAKLEKGEAVE